jgi:hypothetical protein
MPHNPSYNKYPARLENEERVRPIDEIGERLMKIGSLLTEDGKFKLGRTEISPPKDCRFIIRFELTPKGEFSLKLELVWDENGYSPNQLSSDLEITR